MSERVLRCYARGRDDTWEAFCVDLDLAVQGGSLKEVKNLLSEAIESYVQDAVNESPEEARRLLSRRAPFGARAKLALQTFLASRSGRRGGGDYQTSFDVPCHA